MRNITLEWQPHPSVLMYTLECVNVDCVILMNRNNRLALVNAHTNTAINISIKVENDCGEETTFIIVPTSEVSNPKGKIIGQLSLALV